MPIKLKYITNNSSVAKIVEKCGVDRIWIDLEKIGKEQRQSGMDTVKSQHEFSDIDKIKNVLSTSKVLVRINPIYNKTKNEVDEAVARGADIIMLPMFKTVEEAKRFIDYVGGRAKTMLLVETTEAANNIELISSLDGVDEIHIGLNDLHLALKLNFMFELLANGTIDKLLNIITKHNVPCGFGGIASLNGGLLPAKYVVPEHYRLNSNMAILSRSFSKLSDFDNLEDFEKDFQKKMSELRSYELEICNQPKIFFDNNHNYVAKKVKEISSSKF